MRKLVAGIILGVMLTGSVSAAEIDMKRTAVISGVIMRGNLSKVEKALDKWGNDGSKKPISLVINSPGGSVATGFFFLNKMEAARAKGVKINCYVADLAASMAFQILMHCDSRTILSRSFLLWHPVRVNVGGFGGEAMTAKNAESIAIRLGNLDRLILSELYSVLGVSSKYIDYHFYEETLHVGESLSWDLPDVFTSKSFIKNIYEALNNPNLPRSEEFSIFGKGKMGIEYIAPDYVLEMFGYGVE